MHRSRLGFAGGTALRTTSSSSHILCCLLPLGVARWLWPSLIWRRHMIACRGASCGQYLLRSWASLGTCSWDFRLCIGIRVRQFR